MNINAVTKEQNRTRIKGQNSVRDWVLALYRNGYSQKEILHFGDSRQGNKTGPSIRRLVQSNISRWISKGRDADPDLEIWHLLNKRKRRPGMYTNWEPNGRVLLGPFYERLTDTLYLGPGMNFSPTGAMKPGKVIRTGPGWKPPYAKLKDSDAAGPYLAELSSLGYSQRDLLRLWKRRPTRQPKLDNSPRVRGLVGAIMHIRARPFGLGTINHILKTYQFKDDSRVAEGWRSTKGDTQPEWTKR